LKPLVIISLSGACALGCGDPLVDPATVVAPRIVGARVRAADDIESAEPRAGQGGSIDWLALSNNTGALPATAAFCAAEPSSLGVPRCSGAPFDELSVELRFGEPLRIDFTLPGDLAPGSDWLAWLGSCDGAAVPFDADESSFVCSAAGGALVAFYRGRVPAESPNRNPVLADDEISLAGEPWLESDAAPPGAACASLELPSVRPGDELEIAFALGGDDREALPVIPDEYAAHDRESLVYTHVATLAGLDRAFSAIDFDSDTTGFSLPFTIATDAAPSAAGEAVNFYLLVRDERGGVDWARRDACLVPAPSGGT